MKSGRMERTARSTRAVRSRFSGWCRAGALLALGSVIGPAAVEGQPAWRFTPHLGAWLPMGPVREELENGDPVRLSQVGDVLIGGRAGRTLGGGYSVDVTVAASPGQVARTDATGTRDIPALALIGSARLTRSGRLNSDFLGHFGAGFGLIRRSGRGWGATHFSPTLVAGFGLETPVVPGTAFIVEVEMHASRSRLALPSPEPPRGSFRADIVVSFGIAFPSVRREDRLR